LSVAPKHRYTNPMSAKIYQVNDSGDGFWSDAV
jgi:hypothetical protein